MKSLSQSIARWFMITAMFMLGYFVDVTFVEWLSYLYWLTTSLIFMSSFVLIFSAEERAKVRKNVSLKSIVGILIALSGFSYFKYYDISAFIVITQFLYYIVLFHMEDVENEDNN